MFTLGLDIDQLSKSVIRGWKRHRSALRVDGRAGPEEVIAGDYEGLRTSNESGISCSVVTGYGRNKYEAVI